MLRLALAATPPSRHMGSAIADIRLRAAEAADVQAASGDAPNAGAFALGGRLECFERNDLVAGERALAAVGVDLDAGRTHRVSCSA